MCPNILIVDDEPSICAVLTRDLSEQGYACAYAYDGNEALAKLAAEDFDVALLDIRLPGMSGIELLARIRINYPNTEAIMVTGVDDTATVVDAMKMGAQDYIVKPFDLAKMNTSIRAILETKKNAPGKRDYKSILDNRDKGDEPTEETLREIDAIARGVEARHNLLYGHSRIVIEETVAIAQQLNISEETIQKWFFLFSGEETRKTTEIKSSLNKLKDNPLAQEKLGISAPYRHLSKSDETRN